MRTVSARLASILIVLALPAAAADIPSSPAMLTAVGIAAKGAGTPQGGIWFELDRIDQRFVVDVSAQRDALIALLQDSAHTGRSLVVEYDPDGGFRAGDDVPTYIVRQLTYDGNVATGQAPADDKPLASSDASETALAHGIALAGAAEPAAAHEQLLRALAGSSLRQALRMLALKTDGYALQDLAYLRAPGLERDKLFVGELADFLAWKALATTDPDLDLALSGALVDLGDYDGAIALLKKGVAAGGPADMFWHYIRIGAIYRTKGDYTHALEALDALTVNGPPAGMAYHYHRGWTLTKMHRYVEALAEFTVGMKGQPDYSWALLKRACAYAGLGRWSDAASDQEKALVLMEQAAVTPSGGIRSGDLDRARAVLTIYNKEDATADADGLCEGYFDAGDMRRDPSPLLKDLPREN